MKIKRIIFIFFLTTSILFGLFYYEQKRVDAIPPLVWVGVNVATAIVIGAIAFMMDDDGANKLKQVDDVDPNTGQVDISDFEGNGIDFCGEMKVWTSADDKKIYPFIDAWSDIFSDRSGWSCISSFPVEMTQGLANAIFSSSAAYFLYQNRCNGQGVHNQVCWAQINNDGTGIDDFLTRTNTTDGFTNEPVSGGMGNKFSGTWGANPDGTPTLSSPIDMFEFQEDIPVPESCFDGILNQNETGIDCGGVCEINFGLVCPPAETCFDGIMNQDETGVDFGGVCGTGNPVTPPPDPGTFIDDNTDGIDDITGLTGTGSVPIAVPGTGDSSTYDTSLPGDVSEFGETDWGTLITDFVSQNPLVLLATNSSINTSNESCLLTFSLWGKAMEIDFCSIEWMVNLFGTFVLGLMTIRSIFIAMGI